MKKIAIILLVVSCQLLVVVSTFAQTLSPTASSSAAPTEQETSKRIERIKDIVASRVAELKLVEKRGILGKVESSTSTQITIIDIKGNKRIVDIDEITAFSDPNSKIFGISDVKKDDTLGIIGLLNKETEHILARFVNRVNTIPTRVEGIIKSIDKVNFIITVVDENGQEQKLDNQTSTKISSFDNGEMTRSSFSKLSVGQRIFASGFPEDKDKTLLNVSRIIYFISLPPSKDMTRNLNASPSASPSITR